MSSIPLYWSIVSFSSLEDTDENSQGRSGGVIPTNPNPVYGCLPDNEAEILVDTNVAYEGSKALSNIEPVYDTVDTEPDYDIVDTISMVSTP